MKNKSINEGDKIMKNFLKKLKDVTIKLKNTDAITKFLLGLSIIFIGIMIVYFIAQFQHIHAYHQREAYGNERWHQVENILDNYDERIEELETKLEMLQ